MPKNLLAGSRRSYDCRRGNSYVIPIRSPFISPVLSTASDRFDGQDSSSGSLIRLIDEASGATWRVRSTMRPISSLRSPDTATGSARRDVSVSGHEEVPNLHVSVLVAPPAGRPRPLINNAWNAAVINCAKSHRDTGKVRRSPN